MKLNIECVRDLLLYFENTLEFQTELSIKNVLDHFSNDYEEDVIQYTCSKLEEGNLIKLISTKAGGKNIILAISDITFDGHQFIENIRNKKIWKPINSISEEIGVASIQGLTQIAAGVVTQIISKHLGY